MTGPRITPRPTPSTTTEQSRDIRARALKFVLDCRARKRGRLPDKSGLDDTERSENACAKNEYIG